MIWCALALSAQTDLEGARQRATENAIVVARAEADARAASGAVWSSASGALPEIELFATANTGAGLTQFGFERPVATQTGLGATGSWTLIDPSSWSAAVAAQHSLEGQRAMLDWTRVTARRDATLAVAALWRSEAELAAWEDASVDAQRAADGIESLVTSGLRPRADGARARATAAQLQALAKEAAGEVTGRCAELQALLRDDVDGVCTLVEPAFEEPRDRVAEHPALVAAQQALSAAKTARTSALLSRGPTVAATGTVAQYTAGGSAGIGWSAGVDARLPILSGGSGHGDNRIAKAERDDAELALESQQLDLAAATLRAEARWEAVGASNDALRLAELASEEAMTLVEARYREGLEGIEAWQSARRARDEARVARARGRAAALEALAELEAVRGVW